MPQPPGLAPPNGNDPRCGFDPTRLPGPKPSWTMPDPDAGYLTTFGAIGITGANATVEAMMVRSGGITAVATPNIYANTLAQLGTSATIPVAIRQAVSGGGNLMLQLYYTNVNERVIHAFVNQCTMTSFALNAVSPCTFALPTVQRPTADGRGQESVNIANLRGRFNWEMVLQTPTAYKARVAVGPLAYAGTLLPTPPNQLVARCTPPQPAPSGFPLPLGPAINPTFTDFAGIYTFVGAGTAAIPPLIYRPSEVIPALR
jgi:hypothetical protein